MGSVLRRVRPLFSGRNNLPYVDTSYSGSIRNISAGSFRGTWGFSTGATPVGVVAHEVGTRDPSLLDQPAVDTLRNFTSSPVDLEAG